jgi:hypothetical protein
MKGFVTSSNYSLHRSTPDAVIRIKRPQGAEQDGYISTYLYFLWGLDVQR